MSGDGVSATSQQISQLIEGEKFVQGAAALAKPRFGMMIQRFRPGSALGDHRR